MENNLSQEINAEAAAFDRLLAAMPRIADAVNAFASEEIQRFAYSALLTAFGLPPSASLVGGDEQTPPADESPDAHTVGSNSGEMPSPSGVTTSGNSGEKRRKPPRKAPAKKSYQRVDVNFRPADGISLRDFVDKKEPASNFQRNLAIVYYFEEHLAQQAITVPHVLAGYRECDWKPPTDPENSLSKTASQYGWLVTSNREAITTTHAGRSFVEYEMPAKADKKS